MLYNFVETILKITSVVSDLLFVPPSLPVPPTILEQTTPKLMATCRMCQASTPAGRQRTTPKLMTVCRMCQASTPSGKQCEYCGRPPSADNDCDNGIDSRLLLLNGITTEQWEEAIESSRNDDSMKTDWYGGTVFLTDAGECITIPKPPNPNTTKIF